MFNKFTHHLKYLIFDQRLTQNSGAKIKVEDIQKLEDSSPLLETEDWCQMVETQAKKGELTCLVRYQWHRHCFFCVNIVTQNVPVNVTPNEYGGKLLEICCSDTE